MNESGLEGKILNLSVEFAFERAVDEEKYVVHCSDHVKRTGDDDQTGHGQAGGDAIFGKADQSLDVVAQDDEVSLGGDLEEKWVRGSREAGLADGDEIDARALAAQCADEHVAQVFVGEQFHRIAPYLAETWRASSSALRAISRSRHC